MELLKVILFFVIYQVENGIAYAPKSPLVYTKYGPVVGSVEHTLNKREFSSFRGIPYAKPPVGELRFKPPRPPTVWEFAVNGTHDAPFCIQKNYFFADPEVEGQEDCLYLNIYIPKIESTNLLPVMVFIHWGGFFAGRGSSDFIGPEYLMDRDVILVTFNYRLGVFGFFSTLDDNAPGNNGLKDQVMALKFVQENIEKFGGDKNRVTIFGQSAGGGSTSLHLVSPSSRGLFQQAISQSGVSLDLWARPANALQSNVTAALAAFTGCSENIGNNSALVKCLQKVDAVTLTATAENFKYFSIEPLTPYTLVSETQTELNPEPFLTKDPLEYLATGDFAKVPWIVGTVQDEGILRVSALVRQQETLQQLNANFSAIIPTMLALPQSGGADFMKLYNNIDNFYLGNKSHIDVDDPRSIQGFIDLYSDRAFNYGLYQTVILQSQMDHKPIWMYSFNYKGQYTYGDLFAATTKNVNFNWGVSHCDDLLYLFRSPALFPELSATTDLAVKELMLSLWTNFAFYGDPDPLKHLNWNSLSFDSQDQIKNENLKFLNISGHYKTGHIIYNIDEGFYKERMLFWVNQTLAENFPGLG